ncbi:MAG: winged helix-turn-helix transcriptional regulator [Syntrophobacteraceae bacterium]|jgi:DNA-binding IclR family transcriptional regulator
MTAGYKRIAAVKTTFEILEYLSDHPGPVSQKEIGIALKLPYGTVMSHVATLCDGGYLVQAGDGIRIGPRMSVFWLKMKAHVEMKRATIEQALSVLGGI